MHSTAPLAQPVNKLLPPQWQISPQKPVRKMRRPHELTVTRAGHIKMQTILVWYHGKAKTQAPKSFNCAITTDEVDVPWMILLRRLFYGSLADTPLLSGVDAVLSALLCYEGTMRREEDRWCVWQNSLNWGGGAGLRQQHGDWGYESIYRYV